MEIFINTLDQITPDLILYGIGTIVVLALLLVYRIVVAPKIRHRKVLEKVRQMKYEKESRKVSRESVYTWGTFIRSEANTAYTVREVKPEMNTQFNKIMRDLSEEEKTNF